MSFLNKIPNMCCTEKRKENDSYKAHHFENKIHLIRERASVFTSRGTITLEAALATVFFFFGTLCMVGLFEIASTQIVVKSALHSAAKEVAMDVCTIPEIPVGKMEQKIIDAIGQEDLEKSLIVGGKTGIDCSHSKKYWNTTIMDLSVRYQIEIPIFMFRLPLISREEVIRVKGWTGYEEKSLVETEEMVVYVTDYGQVYHVEESCAYLDLSVRKIGHEQVSEMRNFSGEKYKKCSQCKKVQDNMQDVYITDYGSKYHYSLDCKGLKRTVYTMLLSEVKGMGGCSKCAK